jgi:D-hexose-6-phosphate mutarotase
MLYTSERNHGCRFLEIAIFGYRAIIMENDKIRTTFILDKGCEIIEFNDKETDTDFIWRSPLGLSCLKKIESAKKDSHILTDGYTGGWFECFPHVGGESTFKGSIMPQYGEVCYLPWEYTIVKDEAEEVELKCFVRTTKTPYLLEKTFRVEIGVPTLFIEETAKNTGNEDLHFQWGHHPNFGSNFIDENCVIDMQGKEINVNWSTPNSRLEVGTKGIWPYIKDKTGAEVDLSKVGAENSGICEVIEVFNLTEGKTTVRNFKKGLGIQLEWDLNMFRHNVIWHVCNGDVGYPRYGKTYVLGFVPRNDDIWGLSDTPEQGSHPVIKAGESKKTWFNASVLKF